MSATLTQDILTELHVDVKGLIFHTVKKFCNHYGGEFEELLQDAYILFLEAYYSYNGETKQSTWIAFRIYNGLLDKWRVVRYRKNNLDRTLAYDIQSYSKPECSFNVGEFIEGLSEDAATVVKLCLESPEQLASLIASKGDQPRNIRSSVRDFLKQLGWSSKRVVESFSEIRSAL